MAPIPIILCGKSERIAGAAIQALQPEYEVIHLIMSADAGRTHIAGLLAGRSAPSESGLATNNYGAAPAAVLLGGGFTDEDVDEMMKAAAADGDAASVPWLRPDQTKAAPPLGPEYGRALVGRAKELLSELQEKDEMKVAKVQWY